MAFIAAKGETSARGGMSSPSSKKKMNNMNPHTLSSTIASAAARAANVSAARSSVIVCGFAIELESTPT
jgi:hypothetical protein